MEFKHTSVLLDESVAAVVKKRDGIYVDCTMGGAGHSALIAAELSSAGWLICLDQDIAAVRRGQVALAGTDCKVTVVHDNFSNLRAVLADLGVEAVNGILFDLGVSSHQLDTAERGFSYMQDAPLDMRMDVRNPLSANEVVNKYSQDAITKILQEYGEEKWAKRIAQFICRARSERPIATTGELVEIIKQAIPAAARREGPHPAKRTFQAIRIEVNNEIGILAKAFEDSIEHLLPGGRIGIITFHSLEDRIAKQTLQRLAKTCHCPPQLPICVCNTVAKVRVVGKAVTPSPQEIEDNPRARSARLRVGERL